MASATLVADMLSHSPGEMQQNLLVFFWRFMGVSQEVCNDQN